MSNQLNKTIMKKKDFVNEEKANRLYLKKSGVASDKADQLAWMFVLMMAACLISGHIYRTFLVSAMLSCVYMLLGVIQCVWQAVAAWIFKQQIKRERAKHPEITDKEYPWPKDYPNYMGGGAWVFYYAKMITITAAVCFFVYGLLD